MSHERSNFIFLGRILGTFTGCDGDPGEYMIVYNFEPVVGLAFPRGDITLQLGTGMVETHDDEGNVLASADILPLIAHLPRP